MKPKPLVLLLVVLLAGTLTFSRGTAVAQNPKADLANMQLDFSVSRSLPYLTAGQVVFENVIIDNQRFAVLMSWKKAKLEPVLLQPLNTVQIPNKTIVIRYCPPGYSCEFPANEWDDIPAAVTDPAGDVNAAYPPTTFGTDLAEVHLARDQEYLYVLMTMHNSGPLLNALYIVELQQYLFQLHTPGDLIVSCQNRGNGWQVAVGDRNGLSIANYPPSAGYAAAGNGWVEWKVPLSDLQNRPDTPHPYFPAAPVDRGIDNRFIRAYIHPGPHPTTLPPSDSNDSMTRPLIINFYK